MGPFLADAVVAVPVRPPGVDTVVTDLVLEPLKLLECDVAEVGGNDLDPGCNGLEVVERGEGSVVVFVESVWPPDSDLGWVRESFVGGVLPGGGSLRRWVAGDLEN